MAGRQFTIPTIFTAVDKMSGVIGKMSRNLHGFAGKAEIGLARAERGFRSLMSPLTTINNMLRGFGVYIGGYLLFRLVGNLIDIFSQFEQANANLAAIMGSTVEKNKALSDQAKMLGLTTAKTATEVVGLQIELARLGFELPQILNMSAAIVSGSIALDAALDRTALLAGAMTRSFQNFRTDGSDTQHIMDVLAKGSNDTALSFTKLETSLPIVAGAANAVGISFERTVALLGALANAGIDAHMSATSLRNIFIDSRRKGHTYSQVLENIAKHVDTLTPAFNKFGRRTAVSAQILVRNLKQVEAETLVLQQVQSGYTNIIASKRLDTYIGSVTLLKAAYQGLILSIDDGTGAYSHFLKRLNQTLRGVLLLVNGNEIATQEFNSMDKGIQANAKTLLFWLNVLKWVAVALITLKAIIISWNIVAGIYAVWMKVVTAATWLWNTALAANPIGIIIIAITAFIGAVMAASKIYSDWEKRMISSGWDTKVENFFRGLGVVILDYVLGPLQTVLEIISKLTGFEWVDKAVAGIEKFRQKMVLNAIYDEQGKPRPMFGQQSKEEEDIAKQALNPQTAQTEFIYRMAKQDANVRLFINDPKGRVEAEADSAWIKINRTSTHEAWNK